MRLTPAAGPCCDARPTAILVQGAPQRLAPTAGPYGGAVRVVGGVLGGRRLEAPAGDGARPTSDRAREAVFNMLFAMSLPEGASVLDLFAGSGALGIEALSRGAAHATFVDSDAAACRAITANLTALGISDRTEVIRSDAAGFLNTNTRRVDLAFADPPYEFGGWPDLLDALDTVGARVLVCESDREIEPGPHHRWQTHRTRRYGTPVITILTHRRP